MPAFLQNVATISSGNDAAIGQMIADALDKVRIDLQLSAEYPIAASTSPYSIPAPLAFPMRANILAHNDMHCSKLDADGGAAVHSGGRGRRAVHRD